MIDKFQKLFGPNPPRVTQSLPEQPSLVFDDTAEDIEQRKQIARIKNQRRVLGLVAMGLAVAVVAPMVLSPNEHYADRGAKLEIPRLENNPPAKVVSVEDVKKEAQSQHQISVKQANEQKARAAASLSAENKVTADAKPAHPNAEKAVENAQSMAAGKNKAAQIKSDTKSDAAREKASVKAAQAKAAANEADRLKDAGPLRASANGRYFIQVIATSNKTAAQKRAQALTEMGVPAYTEIVHRRGSDLWRVRVGRFMTLDEARRALDILALNSIENGGINQEPAKKSQ